MNRKIISLAASALCISMNSFADDAGFYGTIGIQNSTLDEDLSGLSPFGNVSDNDTSFNITAGYSFNKYIAIEGGYMDMGEILGVSTGNVTTTGDFQWTLPNLDIIIPNGTTANASLDAEVDGWTLGGVFSLPVSDNFSVYGKAGYYFWDADARLSAALTAGSITVNGITYNAPISDSISVGYDGEDPYWGIGAEYVFSESMAIRADYNQFEVDSFDVETIGAALKYNF